MKSLWTNPNAHPTLKPTTNRNQHYHPKLSTEPNLASTKLLWYSHIQAHLSSAAARSILDLCPKIEKFPCGHVPDRRIRSPQSVFSRAGFPRCNVFCTVAQKCHNTFQIKNTPQSPQHISKLETQFDNCSKHISIFTTHFTLENKTIENTQQKSKSKTHFKILATHGNIGERRYWSGRFGYACAEQPL